MATEDVILPSRNSFELFIKTEDSYRSLKNFLPDVDYELAKSNII